MRPRSSGGSRMPRKLRRRIVRQIEVALENIQCALSGGGFHNDDERHASLAILRMAPRLFRPATPADADAEARANQPLYHPSLTEAQADELLEVIEVDGKSREETAALFAGYFHEFGPEDGEYQTLEEAQEHGRRVWDRVMARVGTVTFPTTSDDVPEGSES